MKRTLMAVALSLSSLMLATAALAAQKYRLGVDGLACPFCAFGVEKKLGAVKDVQRVEVDIGASTVVVTMAEGAALDEAAARKAVKEAGFSMRSFEPVAANTTGKAQAKR